MKIKLILCDKMKNPCLYFTILFLTLNVAEAQVPAGLLCRYYTGQAPEAYGPGDCAGNSLRMYDFSSVYPGMKGYYNSLAPEHNIIGLGKKFTLSDVAIVDLNPAKPYIWLGDGTIVDLELRTSGPFTGMYLAKDRNLLSDYLKKDSATQLTQTAMDGTSYKYALMSGTRYRLSEITSRTGIKTLISVTGSGTQFLKFGPDTINITTEGANTFFRNASDASKWVKLVRDQLTRLTTILYYDGTRYDLVYHGTSSLLFTETLVSPEGSETTKFLYDKIGRLASIDLPNNTSVRYIRNLVGKFSEAFYPNGQGQKISYDKNGYVKSIKTYVIGSPETVLEEATYTYDPNGKFLSMTYPEGPDTIKIEGQYYAQDPRMPVGSKQYKNGTLVAQLDQLRGLYTWLSSMDTLKDGSGKILSQMQYVYSPILPFLPSSIIVREGPNKGAKQEIQYAGAQTTSSFFNANGTKTLTQVYKGDLPFQAINHLAPPSKQLREFAFDSKKQLSSQKLNGTVVAEYRYNPEGRPNYYKDENNERFTYYDAKGYIIKEEDKILSSGLITTTTYTREFHSQSEQDGDNVKSFTVTTVYPKETVVVKTEYDVAGKVTGRWKNGVLIG